MSAIWPFDHIKNKHTLYCGKDCMKKFCFSIREHATDLLKFEKRETSPLTKEELELHQDATNCYICGKRISKNIKSKS